MTPFSTFFRVTPASISVFSRRYICHTKYFYYLKRATQYLRITVKPGWSESFTEKIVSLGNSTQTIWSALFVDCPTFRAGVELLQFVQKILWVRHGDHLPGETRWTEFCKKAFCETLQTTFCTLFVMRTYRLLKEQDNTLPFLVQWFTCMYNAKNSASITLWSMENAWLFAFTDECCQKYAWHQKSF